MQKSFFQEDQFPEHQRAIDELFNGIAAYRRSSDYFELIRFIGRFTRFTPYNAFLLYVQNPKVTFVATPGQWLKRHQRRVKPGARPLLVIAPKHPILFVYDLADTEGKPIPEKLLDPFETKGEISAVIWAHTVDNALDDGIFTSINPEFSNLHAGDAGRRHLITLTTNDHQNIECYYEIRINSGLNQTSRYATLVHELGHIYAGHLGKAPGADWPDRQMLTDVQVEFEAETISYLVCKRLGIETKSEEYLALKAKEDIELPYISMEIILKTVNRIQDMGKNAIRKTDAQ